MKRIQDKIKDLVEPQSFEQVGNFAEDPAQALAAYRFTDVTSDLLSRWLDGLAELSAGKGAARALAGARGVGKSHTLAVFGALSGSERLRQTVEDGHVLASAQRLAGRRYLVVRVERGTRPTLADELAASFAAFFGGSESQWGNRDPAEVLAVAASRAMGETLVVIIDTAFNRPARVSRDDGPYLGSLATAARDLNVFLALALDDDIADADGANVAVAGTYRIDYLDPENLYRVADQFVLRKKPQVGDTLREIYQALRATVHEFNWSQARFSSVYPVHPLVAEVASGVRLFLPKFAFLPFAAAAAARATSRPALALVLLDEVFDATEEDLRLNPELRELFATYDQLTAACIGQLPIMQRYQARLILKSLFVLSLDGRDATPGEMCAALLLTDEDAGGDAPRRVAETLARFAAEAPEGSFVLADGPGGETRYRFRIASHFATPAAQVQESAPKVERVEAAEAVPPEPEPPKPEPPKPSPEVVESPRPVHVEEPRPKAEAAPAPSHEAAEPLSAELLDWARLLTGRPALGEGQAGGVRAEVRAALLLWAKEWTLLGLAQKFDALPDACLTTRVWKAEAQVRKSFGRAATAVEAEASGKIKLEEALERIARAFGRSPSAVARLTSTLEDLCGFVETVAARERVRAYLAAAEPTGVEEIEVARRELLNLAHDSNNFLEGARRERFERLWREWRSRYGEHYAALHDKTVGAGGARDSLRDLRRSERWREFESLARLPVVSTQVWRQAEALLRAAEGARCGLDVRRLLAGQPACACQFRLSRAEELSELPQELEALMERGLGVYRRTLRLLGTPLAISLDALARRDVESEASKRARLLSAAFAHDNLPERFARQDARLIERALKRMPAPPPVRVAAPNGESGLLTRDELRARFEQWLDELPEQPVLIEVVSKAELNAP
ncbi:MAG: hypothetical protein JOZ96_12280 [Acidobacteria bacterium]|nr:hypothetical protein [Acidobacteriota bacterium]